MKRKIRKRGIATLAILLLGIILYKGVISGHSMPIFKANPILLYIDGGPGDPETPFITPY